jgi:hypothetical protein
LPVSPFGLNDLGFDGVRAPILRDRDKRQNGWKAMSYRRGRGSLLVLLAAGLLFAGYGHYAKYGHFDLSKLAEDFYSSYFAQLLGMVFTVSSWTRSFACVSKDKQQSGRRKS